MYMKELRTMMMCLLCMAIATFALTSCLSDDDDDEVTAVLTPAEKTQQINAMEGFYNGHVYFDNDTTHAMDSVATTWYVTAADSVLSIPAFPVSCLANSVSHSTAKAVLKAAPDQHFNAVLHPFWNINKDGGYYTFMTVPKENSLSFQVELEGKTHQVMLNYATSMNAYNSYGQQVVVYTSGAFSQPKISAYVLVKDISIDYTAYTCNGIFLLGGTK